MLTTFSLMLLLAVVAVGARIHSLTTERGIVEWPLKPELYTATAELKEASTNVIASNFESYQLPDYSRELQVRKVAAAPNARQFPAVKFKSVDKEINIIEEVFSPTNHQINDESEWREIQGAVELPTKDEFIVAKVEALDLVSTSLVALLDNVEMPTETMIAEEKKTEPAAPVAQVVDKVNVVQAKTAEVDAEPEFFEYENAKDEIPVAMIAATPTPAVDEYSPPKEMIKPVAPEVTTQSEKEELEDLVAYNYAMPSPVVAKIPTLKEAKKNSPLVAHVTTQPPVNTQKKSETNALMSTHDAVTVVAGLSVANTLTKLRQFELRAQDDAAQTLQDHGAGVVEIRETIASENGSRSFVLLQRDHVPTHTDIPVVRGKVELEIPAFEKDFLSQYARAPKQLPLGYLLVELDDETESVQVDGLKNVQTFFTSDFKVTKDSDYRYVLFAGVEAGNRLVTYLRGDGKKSQRIVHIHEEEVTFDPNLYGSRGDLALNLYEEDLLSRTKKELSISGEQLELTFSGVKGEKLSTNTYRLKAPPLLLGSRHYLTLTHQNEEIFLGVDKSGEAEVPSESLIREVIKKFNLEGHGSACLIQVNLDGPVKKYEVLAESHAQAHVSYGLALDEDGQFYESLGESSRRLFIMSENQGGEETSANAKVNIRLEYQDGSKRNFASFCSPNTYLVEQL
jgi:hypothetical protein